MIIVNNVATAAATVWALRMTWRNAPHWTTVLDARQQLGAIARRHPHPLIRRAATCATIGRAHQPLEAA